MDQNTVVISRDDLKKAIWLATFAIFNLKQSPIETTHSETEFAEWRDRMDSILKTAPTNARQEYPQMITTTTESNDRSVQDSVDVAPIGDGVLTGTPDAPEPGTQVETLIADVRAIADRIGDIQQLLPNGHLMFVSNSAFMCAVRLNRYLNDLASELARQSPTVALTNDRDEEETR